MLKNKLNIITSIVLIDLAIKVSQLKKDKIVKFQTASLHQETAVAASGNACAQASCRFRGV
jgi:hypothetical protein